MKKRTGIVVNGKMPHRKKITRKHKKLYQNTNGRYHSVRTEKHAKWSVSYVDFSATRFSLLLILRQRLKASEEAEKYAKR
jgi:hypothetical protein